MRGEIQQPSWEASLKSHLLCVLAVVSASLLLSLYQVTTYDVFWHLKVGQVILEEGRLIERNLFSSTYPDHPWANPEWLFQLILALVYRAGDWAGVSLFKVCMVVLLGLALFRSLLQREGKPLPAAALTVFALSAMQFRFTERPHLFSYLFLIITLLIVERHRRHGGRLVWILPPLFALWSNIHPELIIGLLCLAAVAVGDFLNGLGPRGAGKGWNRQLAAASTLCVPASMLNPEGYHVLTFPFLHTFLGPIIEVEEYANSSFQAAPLFWLLLAALMAFLIFSRRRDWTEILLAGGTALLGVIYLRATPYLFLAGTPILFARLARLRSAGGPRSQRLAELITLVAGVAALTWALGFERLMPYRWGVGLDETDFPSAAADLLESGRLPANLYHGYSWGGYLMYRLYPAMGVFQDGRVQAYPQEFVARLHSKFSIEDWPRILDDYHVHTALVVQPQVDLLFPREEWGIVFWDERWVLLLRRDPAHAALLSELEYRHFLPGADIASIRDKGALERLALEMERSQVLRRRPSPVTDNNLGTVRLRLGREREAEEAFRSAAGRGYAPAWANLGHLFLRQGRAEKAGEALEQAVRLDPSLTGAARLLARIRGGYRGGDPPPAPAGPGD